jgi:hypothetical protein
MARRLRFDLIDAPETNGSDDPGGWGCRKNACDTRHRVRLVAYRE